MTDRPDLKTEQLIVKVSVTELAEISEAAERAGYARASWARATLLQKAREAGRPGKPVEIRS